ncbi:MAG: ABC transporter ATP-binding protein [Pirellulales bacterium]|nr:ABC transporter ATP-binding protein [Pirellulales bacterium]
MIVSSKNLSKSYGTFRALTDCNISVKSGEVFGLLGPNGAGKTTLLRTLLGFIKPTSGQACIAGFDCASQSVQVRQRTAYLPGEARLFRRMRGHHVLDFFSRLRADCDRKKCSAIAERLQLDGRRQVSRMSTGMRQKLALSMVLAIDCPLVILDEPTANLDPSARAEVLALVLEARNTGRTVIFSSHVLSEIESTCDRVVIMRAGHIAHEQSIATLRRRHRIYAQLAGPLTQIPESLADSISIIRESGSEAVLESADSLTRVLDWLSGLPLSELKIEPVGLSAVYDRYHREDARHRDTASLPRHISPSSQGA